MRFFNVMFATIIAFGVVYNTARIALGERSRELATLRVIGRSRARGDQHHPARGGRRARLHWDPAGARWATGSPRSPPGFSPPRASVFRWWWRRHLRLFGDGGPPRRHPVQPGRPARLTT
ncbi:MAG: hypothetical protein U1F77_16855 [Kiritimatiellia bacterium]